MIKDAMRKSPGRHRNTKLLDINISPLGLGNVGIKTNYDRLYAAAYDQGYSAGYAKGCDEGYDQALAEVGSGRYAEGAFDEQPGWAIPG